VVVSEAASTRVKEKTNLLACVISVLTTFATSFTIPYLISDQYAGLGGKVGFVYGSFCMAMFVLAFLFVPELKNRSLEEVDQMFASDTPLRKFGSIKTQRVEDIGNVEVLEEKLKTASA
jgi:MFS transporter, SP family, sugar:H+ symporter